MWLFLAFIGVPLIEIALFIQVGGVIGLWPTLAIVLVTAVLGSALVRSQGIRTLGRLRAALEGGKDPSRDLAHGAMILFSGLLLLTPGFFTDAVGLAFMVPIVRDRVFDRVSERIIAQSVRMDGAPDWQDQPRPTVIDGEFEEIDPDSVPRRPASKPSGWTRSGAKRRH